MNSHLQEQSRQDTANRVREATEGAYSRSRLPLPPQLQEQARRAQEAAQKAQEAARKAAEAECRRTEAVAAARRASVGSEEAKKRAEEDAVRAREALRRIECVRSHGIRVCEITTATGRAVQKKTIAPAEVTASRDSAAVPRDGLTIIADVTPDSISPNERRLLQPKHTRFARDVRICDGLIPAGAPCRIVAYRTDAGLNDCPVVEVVYDGFTRRVVVTSAAIRPPAPVLSTRQFPRRRRRKLQYLTPAGALMRPAKWTGTPLNAWERAKRAVAAWRARRKAARRDFVTFDGHDASYRRRQEKRARCNRRFVRRLSNILHGQTGFAPRRNRETYWTIEESGFYGTPRTKWERLKRACAAIESFSVSWEHGWTLLARSFGGDETAPLKMLKQDKQRERLKRIVAGLPPFRQPQTARERLKMRVAKFFTA